MITGRGEEHHAIKQEKEDRTMKQGKESQSMRQKAACLSASNIA